MICYAVIDTNVLVSALLSSHNDAATASWPKPAWWARKRGQSPGRCL